MTFFKRLRLTLYFFFAVSITAQSSQPDWQIIEDYDDIRVYSATVSGSEIIKVKTEVLIAASMETIRLILDNAHQRHQWVPHLDHSKVLQQPSNSERLEYSRFIAPWPASDRDFVYRIQMQKKSDKQLVFQMRSEVNQLMPEQTGIVRAELVESTYTMTALSPEQTQVELIFHADPKGWLPVWIINIIQRHLPFMMLKNLRSRAENSHM